MKDIGIISEGPTDQVVLRNIFVGYFNNKAFDFNYLQPVQVKNNPSGHTHSAGNWDQVFKYIQTSRFRGAFGNDFVLIQIDTDFQFGEGVPKEYQIDMNDLSIEEAVESMRQLIVNLINKGQEGFYDLVADRVLFAISHQSIECWLLPIYFPTLKVKAGKVANCKGTLKEGLKNESYYIDDKMPQYYFEASKPYQKNKDLLKLSQLNPSFAIFMSQVQALVKTD